MIRKARMEDIPKIQKMLERSARKGELLARPLGELYDSLRDFNVCLDEKKQIIACCALHTAWEDLGEIRSLFVKEERRQQGTGRRLVNFCMEEARELGIRKVFVLTFNTDFFQKIGFSPVSKNLLPHKIWADCLRCIHFPDCKEEALWIPLEPEPSRKEALPC
jgi:amino-acid N-acetyltransferase